MSQKISQIYCTEIKENLKYFAAWLPSSIFSVGDYGVIEHNCFTRLGNISDAENLNISFTAGEKSPLANLTYTSTGVRTSSFDLSADLIAQDLKAGLKIEFSSENSCFLSLAQCSTQAISNIDFVSLEILNLRERKKWDDEWAVVTEVIEAGKSLIYISKGHGGEVSLALKGIDIQQFIKEVNVEFKIVGVNNIGTHIEGEKGLTPIFKLFKVQKKLLSYKPPRFRPLSENPGNTKNIAEDFYSFDEII